MIELSLKNIKIGNGNPFVLIAGPCVIEDEGFALSTAETLKNICDKAGVPFIYKSSYDKANRTSISSYRGPGLEKGLKILEKVKKELDIPLLSDVHKEEEIGPASEVLDILQIPAFLCRQTDLLVRAAKTGKIVNVKKGQFLAPFDVKNIIAKIESAGCSNIMITERGTTFGYNTLVSDFRALPVMRRFGYPVIFDATHSVQQPGGGGDVSSGQKEFVPYLARAAVAVGCDGLFVEVHPHPDRAPSDGPNMLAMEHLKDMLGQLQEIDHIVKQNEKGCL